MVAKEDFAAIRTGHAHPAMFNKIVADYYGAPTPINQLASFSVPEPRMAVAAPFDKSARRPCHGPESPTRTTSRSSCPRCERCMSGTGAGV
ncbi:Ribosome-recycling factor [Streptomyces griseoloalbus]